MAETFSVSLILLMFLNFQTLPSQAQQAYLNNKQLNCADQTNSTLGNLCNGVSRSCTSYLTFRSISEYDTLPKIADLLSSTPSAIAQVNNISHIYPIPLNTMVIAPVTCSCSGNYYQHDAFYTMKTQEETYFTIANNTYQALTTCQALQAQNVYNIRNLTVGLRFNVPLRCGCPTAKQEAFGIKYLVTYLVAEGESVSSIAELFGVDEQSVLDANELSNNNLVFYFTPVMVPLREELTRLIMVSTRPSTATPTDSSSSKKWIIVGVTIGAVLFVLVLSGFLAGKLLLRL